MKRSALFKKIIQITHRDFVLLRCGNELGENTSQATEYVSQRGEVKRSFFFFWIVYYNEEKVAKLLTLVK